MSEDISDLDNLESKEDYENMIENLEKQIGSVESELDDLESDEDSPELKSKEKKAKVILQEINSQVEFLEEQLEKLDGNK